MTPCLGRQEGKDGFTRALNDLGPLVLGDRCWTDPEEPNRRWTAGPTASGRLRVRFASAYLVQRTPEYSLRE